MIFNAFFFILDVMVIPQNFWYPTGLGWGGDALLKEELQALLIGVDDEGFAHKVRTSLWSSLNRS